MKFAIVYDCLYPLATGGGERQYRQFAEELRRTGHQVDYLTMTQWQDEAPQANFDVIGVAPRMPLYDADGVRLPRTATRFALGVYLALARRRARYDAVIVSGLPVLNVFAARLALIGTLRSTTVFVDYLEVWGRRQWEEYAGVLTGRAAWLLQRLAVALTPIATCHSALSVERLRREGFRRRILRSPGLIAGASDVQPDLSPRQQPYALYVGRHIPDKMVETLPAAVARARKELPQLSLVIVGEGPTSSLVRDAIRRLGEPSWIDMVGFVDEERLDALMGGAACLVNPSRREGYGLVVVEAAAHGTPSVVVDHPGNAAVELVEPGVNGFVASSPLPEDLGVAIARAVGGDAALRRSTRTWYEEAVTTRTISKTVEAIVRAAERG